MRISLIGAGAMGGAMLRAWLDAGLAEPSEVAVFDPAPSDALTALADANGFSLNADPAGIKSDVAVFAVKPQKAREVAPRYAALTDGAVVLSIMAGFSVASLESVLGPRAFVRAMPNLPAQIGVGVTGLYAAPRVNDQERAIIDALIAPTGRGVWVEDEAHIDAVTAVSGSGPAYFFLLAEAMTEAGAKLGLRPETARALAEATLSGAGALVGADGRRASDLRAAVTSPGGTTAAALDVFDRPETGLRSLADDALAAAAARAKALST
ncbi:MAG: pyrroline-5-carboxylate reductase [Pseudomonadota bacterium]